MPKSPVVFAARALWPALVTGLLWCAAAASVAFWVLRFPQGPSGTAPVVVVSGASAASVAAVGGSVPLSRAWGVKAPLTEVDVAQTTRYQLWGVVAGASGQGSALIGIDGQPPKAYRVGQALSEGVYLQRLGHRQAQLGAAAQGPVLFSLSLPLADKAP